MKTITTGGNLYQIALEELGDSSQWARIAFLNGLVDPILEGIVTLKIPEVDPAAMGGVYGA